jgi:uncharacterized protein (TIRG00374 family)
MRIRTALAAWRNHWVVLAGVAGVVLLIVAVDPAKVSKAVGGADWRFLAAMLPVVLLLYASHGVAWWIALRGIGAPVSLRRSVKITFISQAFDLLPGGDLWRVPVVVGESHGKAGAGPVAASVVFDNLVYFFVLTFAMVPAAIVLPTMRLWLALAALPQLAIFAMLMWPTVYDRLADAVSKLTLFRRFGPELKVLGPGFRLLVRPATLVPVVAVDVVCAGLSVALYWLAVTAVHATGASVQQIAFTYASGQVLSGLAVIPAALGAYEGMMTGLLAFQGVAPAAAAAAALLYRAVNDLLMALIGVAVAFVFSPRYLKHAEPPIEPVVP